MNLWGYSGRLHRITVKSTGLWNKVPCVDSRLCCGLRQAVTCPGLRFLICKMGTIVPASQGSHGIGLTLEQNFSTLVLLLFGAR